MKTIARTLIVAFALVVLPGLKAYSASICAELFAPFDNSDTTPRERAKLLSLGDRFYAQPARTRDGLKVRDRLDFQDPVLTEIADGILRQLEIAYRNFSFKDESASSASARRQFAASYLTMLKSTTARLKQDGGVSMKWIVNLGFHAAQVFDTLSGSDSSDRYRDLHFASDIDQATFLMARKIEFKNRNAASRYFLAIPTSTWFSNEGIVELLANGIRLYGLYPKQQGGNSIGDAYNYEAHDRDHANEWINAIARTLEPQFRPSRLIQWHRGYSKPEMVPAGPYDFVQLAKDPTTSPTFIRIHERLRKLVERAKQLPPTERKAAFAALFMMFHEYPDTFYPKLAVPGKLQPDFTSFDPSFHGRFLTRIADQEDIGHGFDIYKTSPRQLFIMAQDSIRKISVGL